VSSSKLEYLWLKQTEWSDETFGKNRKPTGPMNHLKKEVEEVLDNPYDTEEYADCLLLLIDAARLAGMTPESLLDAAMEKHLKNRLRKWGEADSFGVIEHTEDIDAS
jgi:hypothetical protein